MQIFPASDRIRIWRRWTSGVSVTLFLVHIGVLYVVAMMNPASASTWVLVPFLMGPPLALVAAVIAGFPPIGKGLLAVNVTILGIYVALWVWFVKIYLAR